MKEEYNATLRTENDLSSEIEALEENKRGDVDITAANNIASNRSLTAPAACVFNQQPTKKKQKLDDGWKKNACLDNNTESETDEPNPNPNKKTSSLDHDELELVDVSDSDISDDGPPTDTRVKSHGLTVPCDDKLVLKSKDVNKMQFRMVAWAKESHGKQIYSVSWSPDVHSAKGAGENSTNEYDVVRYGASCAGRYITVYECRNSTQDRTTSEQRMDISREDADTEPCDLRPIQLYFDLDPDEIFYICAWGGRGSNHTIVNPFATDQSQAVKDEKISSQPIPLGTDRVRKAVNMKNYDGPKLLCAAGHSGIVKVIDTTRKMLLFSLVGHGDEIYDMKFCRTNDWLLLTASKDESLRLWNIQIPSCLAIFAGEKGHRDCVLSCDFNPIGNYFISSSMDTTIKIWSLETNEIKHAIKKSFELVGEDSSCLKTVTESFPCFSTNQAHNNYVDCVQYVGGHLILSKSVEHVIVLWKPVFEQTKAVAEAPSGIYPLREFRLNRCDLWFMRFHTYESIEGGGFVLAAGNNIGEIKLWDIFGRSNGLLKNNFAKLTTSQCTSAARMVKFSPCGKSLLVGCDDGMLYKWQLI
uniref:Uncharacterized protein n=2 Tax=Leptocylindrus danicus TaxID=163516 RepID=A0A7S2K1B1_9STRA